MKPQKKPNNELSKNLRVLLNKRNETITSLSRALRLTRQSVSDYVDGKGQPNADKLLQIADHFGVSTDYLLGLADDPTPSQDFQGALALTGLSGPALQRILDARSDDLNLNGELLDGLNILLTSSSLRDLLFSLHMVQQSFAVDKDMEADRAAAKAGIKNGLLQGYMDYGKASKAADDTALFEFQAQKALFQVFSEIEGSANSGQH